MSDQPSQRMDTVQGDARIGIALGSGSARGWAHIGVLEALAELGVRPGVVAGSSIGALVGAAYASGQLAALRRWVGGFTWRDILSFMDVTLLEGGFIQGDKLINQGHDHLGNREIGQLPIPFGAVATDLHSGREVWLRDGKLLDAVRASISLPGLFAPVRLGGRWLVDGGLVDPVPVSLCRAMGAQVIIAVNLNGDLVGRPGHHLYRSGPRKADEDGGKAGLARLWERLSGQRSDTLDEPRNQLLSRLLGQTRDTPGLFDVLAGSINIMQDRITRSRMAGDPPDVLLAPRLGELGLMEFDRAGEAISEGRACVAAMRPAIERALKDLR